MFRAQSILLVALFVGLGHTWDFAITTGDRLEFYTNDKIKTDTVRFNFQNLTALTYDEIHNTLLYVDKQSDNDAICGYSISSVKYKCYIERNGRNIQGLAFDPVTELLFFTDTNERSINSFSFKPGSKNNVYGNLIIKMDDGIPTDIAVDSCGGYIYWINTNLTRSTIERARFDGSKRNVLINAAFGFDFHSLAIDQKGQNIFFRMPETNLKSHVYSADLNGKFRESLLEFISYPGDIVPFDQPNTLTVSKDYLMAVGMCSSCGLKKIYGLPKPVRDSNPDNLFKINTGSFVGIAANYKMKDQFERIKKCKHVLVTNETKDSFKIAREYEGPFCVHGIEGSGQSLCKCTTGFTGERCDVSVCENIYCLQGNCSITEEGLPKCRCNAGYSGERCEVNVCHGYCLNNGTCSLNKEDEPGCECLGQYGGERCELPAGLNNGDGSQFQTLCKGTPGYTGKRCDVSVCDNSYCFQGSCSITEEGLSKCRCNAGYSGERCEVNVCHGYCLNNGTCSLNQEDEPVCECIGQYGGERCDLPAGLNNGYGTQSQNEEKAHKNKTISTTFTHIIYIQAFLCLFYICFIESLFCD